MESKESFMRISGLESLRGIAALMVAVGHSLIVLSVDNIVNIWAVSFNDLYRIQSILTRLLLVFFNGGVAVTIFFALSGFVLGLSLDRNSNSTGNIATFYIKRLFRIYPAYTGSLFVVVSTITVAHTYKVFDSSSIWYQLWYKEQITWTSLYNNFFLFSTYLIPIAWSLKVEMIASFFIPFAHLLSRKIGFFPNILILILLVTWAYNSSNLYVTYSYVFYLALISPLYCVTPKMLFSLKFENTLLFLSIIFLFSSRIFFGQLNNFYNIFIESFSSVYIVLFFARQTSDKNPINRFLNLKIVKAFGEYSYSFYLFHFIVLYWIAYAMFLLVPPSFLNSFPLFCSLILALTSISVSYFVSKASYRNIEIPMMAQGKEIGKKAGAWLLKAKKLFLKPIT
jgi:peptidoglycan/LPS O-acetylase OafA/YrhL